MKSSTLKLWRFLIPAILIFVAGSIIGRMTGLWNYSIPNNLKNIANMLPAIVIAVIYYALGLGKYANRFWHRKVIRNLRQKLVSASGLIDTPESYTWKSIKGIFYSLVDNDKSLKAQSELLHFNGLLWTAAADAALVSVGSIVLCLTFHFKGVEGAKWAALLFLGILIVSVLISFALTLKHMSLGSDQVDIIKMKHQSELKQRLLKVESESGN